MAKRPIDLQRDSALSMKVGGADDPSPITGFAKIGEIMHVVKERGIYEVRLADQIDPQRTSAQIPNIHQRILHYGSKDEIVRKTLLTACELVDNNFLPDTVRKAEAIVASFNALKSVAMMKDIYDSLEAEEKKIFDEYAGQLDSDRSFSLPALVNVESRVKTFMQQADQVIISLLGVIKAFYGDDSTKNRFDGFLSFLEQKYGKDDRFPAFIREASRFLRFVRNCRNCVDHERSDQKLVVLNFQITGEPAVYPPSIEVVHTETPQPRTRLMEFLDRFILDLAAIAEMLTAMLCDKNVRDHGAVKIGVVEWPSEIQPKDGVRFRYTIVGGLPPLG